MARKRFRTIKLVAAALVAGLFSTHAANAATPLTTINGTVSDNAGGSGVAKVDAYLLRTNGGVDEYWANRSGTWGWGASATAIPTTLSSGAWSVTASSPAGTSFPAGANWLDGTYRVKATAFDVAGNSATSTVNTFTVDSAIPDSVTVTAPANGATVPNLTTITGTASDNAGGSGIARVDVYLRHAIGGGNYEYWANRSGIWGWGAVAAIPAAVSGTNWSISNSSPAGTVLPSGANLPNGTYILHAWAYDKATNGKSSTNNIFTVTAIPPDTTAPDTVTVTTPPNGATVSALPSLAGTAADNAGGSGIARVDVYLRHAIGGGNYEYWANRSGTWGWGAVAAIPATVSGSIWGINSATPVGMVMPTGANLVDGTYIVHAYAYDKAGNSKVSTNNIFIIDSAAPASVSVTTPANGAFVPSIPSISGAAADNVGGGGIARVDVYLRHAIGGGNYEYWANRSGTWGWGAAASIPATINGALWNINGSSPVGTVMPSGANLVDGTYIVHAFAYDKANNSKVSTNNVFTVDASVPTSVTVTAPANGATVAAIPSITGTASDNAGGTGIARIDAYLRRSIGGGNYEYWANRSGTWGWGAVASIPATISGANWSISSSSPAGTVLPSGANLTNGTYIVHAWAYDKANNGKVSTNNIFTVNATPPDTIAPASVSVTTPANGAIVAAIPTISGAAADNVGGSGIGRVDVYLRRPVSGGGYEYWANRSGTWGWGAVAAIPATVSGETWSISNSSPAGTVLPSGANLVNGTYILHAWAYDKAGNGKASANNIFTVNNSALRASSSVVLSSASANSTISSISLVFTGAISTASATDVVRYSVSVNGVDTTILSAASSKAGSVVTLGFEEGALQAGDRVTVKYDLLDTQSRKVGGQTTITSN